MLIGFFGNLGSGKTLLMCKYAYEDFLKGRKVISHIKLNFKHYSLKLDEMIDLSFNNPSFFMNSVLCIDEMHNIIDARRSNSSLNQRFTQFITQVGKLNCKVLYTTQMLSSQVDLRVRELTDLFIFSIKVGIKDGKIFDLDEDDRISKNEIGFKGYVIKKRFGGLSFKKKKFFYKPVKEDFNRFDTFELVILDRNLYLSEYQRIKLGI